MLTQKKCLSAIVLLFSLVNFSFAQYNILGQDGNRVIPTAAPFLLTTPDARTAGLGEAGVASSPDANAAYWNPAKLVLLPEKSNFSFSYTPWLSKVVSNMYLYHFSGAQKLGEKDALGLSLSYFDLGDIQLTGTSGTLLYLENPYELSASLSYARKLSEQWSMGGSARYVGSNFAGTTTASSVQSSSTVALDIGALYQKDIQIFRQEALLHVGMNMANLGPKMTYLGEETFLPASLRLGTSLSTQLHENHSLAWLVSFSKLLVPTPPIYERDDNGLIVRVDPNDPNSPPVIAAGKNPNRGWFSGTFGSFADAPDGFSEELQEIMIGTGLEYGFREFVAVRAGYYRESQDKGDRKYFTSGLGLRYRIISLDLAYLLPASKKPGRTHPLENTLRVSLQFRFGKMV